MGSRSFPLAVILLITLFAIWLGVPLYSGIEWMKLSPAILVVCCFIVGLFHPKTDSHFLAYAAIVYLVSFALCAFGTNTGSLFGQYLYGNSLGVKVFDTPLVLGIYWLLMSYTSSVLVSRFATKALWLEPVVIKVILASLLMLLADILLEPLASGIDFWYWKNQQAPVQNYTAWFVFAAAFNFLFLRLEIDPRNRTAPWFFCLWVCFLIILNLLPDYLFGQ